MFKFFTKKYKDRINQLERQIDHMFHEWGSEKELYTPITIKRRYEQKVEWVIGGLDLNTHQEIHRPMYGLNSSEANIIAKMVHDRITEQGFRYNTTGYHYRESERCFVIDVKILPEPFIPKNDSVLEKCGKIWKDYV